LEVHYALSNEPKINTFVAPKPTKGELKNAKWPFSVRLFTSLEESVLQSSFV